MAEGKQFVKNPVKIAEKIKPYRVEMTSREAIRAEMKMTPAQKKEFHEDLASTYKFEKRWTHAKPVDQLIHIETIWEEKVPDSLLPKWVLEKKTSLMKQYKSLKEYKKHVEAEKKAYGHAEMLRLNPEMKSSPAVEMLKKEEIVEKVEEKKMDRKEDAKLVKGAMKLPELKRAVREARKKHCPPFSKMKKAELADELARLTHIDEEVPFVFAAPAKPAKAKKAKEEAKPVEAKKEEAKMTYREFMKAHLGKDGKKMADVAAMWKEMSKKKV